MRWEVTTPLPYRTAVPLALAACGQMGQVFHKGCGTLTRIVLRCGGRVSVDKQRISLRKIIDILAKKHKIYPIYFLGEFYNFNINPVLDVGL